MPRQRHQHLHRHHLLGATLRLENGLQGWVPSAMNGQQLVAGGVARREGQLHSGNLHFERMKTCHRMGNTKTNGGRHQQREALRASFVSHNRGEWKVCRKDGRPLDYDGDEPELAQGCRQ